jgi:predicted CoA-binding protein
MTNKPTVVIGASPDEAKYSNKAVRNLQAEGMTVYAVGIKEGDINGIKIHTDKPHFENVHTISLYVGPANQEGWKEYIYSLNPKRIIFNPGTENATFEKEAVSKGIESLQACNLVMLSIGNF